MDDPTTLPMDPADMTEAPSRLPSVTFLLPGDVNSRSVQSHTSADMSKSMASGYVPVSAVIKSRQTSVQPPEDPAPVVDFMIPISLNINAEYVSCVEALVSPTNYYSAELISRHDTNPQGP